MAKKKQYTIISLTQQLIDHLKESSGVIIKKVRLHGVEQYVIYDKDWKKNVSFSATKAGILSIAARHGLRRNQIEIEC